LEQALRNAKPTLGDGADKDMSQDKNKASPLRL
jgi:hypothetical protein